MPWKKDREKEQREELINEWLKRKVRVSELSARFGVSPRIIHKWINRFKEKGRRGLVNKPSVAERVHNRPSEEWLDRIRKLKRKYVHWGAPKLHDLLAAQYGGAGCPSEAAISRWLKKWRLSTRGVRKALRAGTVKRAPLTVALRPNHVWTFDFKGWFKTGDGTRVDPLTVRDLATRYVLAIVLLRSQSIAETKRACERLFEQYGLPECIRVDNGTPFGAQGALGLTRLSAWWVKLGIRVEFIDPGRPGQNGGHEQMHGVYKKETLKPTAYTLKGQKRRTDRWRHLYNHVRPHEALDMRAPGALYRKSGRRLPTKLEHWSYPHGWESRLVKGKGMISLHAKHRYVGEAFEQERIGLKSTAQGWDVYFGPHLIGHLLANESDGIKAYWLRPRRP